MLSTHRVSIEQFDALAAGGGAARGIETLKAAARSRQLVLVRAVLDHAARHANTAGPLPSLETAWDLLVLAQKTDPDALDVVMTHPNIGVWATYSLRYMRGLVSDESTPLWAVLGHLHNIAAAAAIRAQLGFEAPALVHKGNLILPTLGVMRYSADEAWHASTVSYCNNEIVVEGASRDDWFQMRSLTADGISVWLDDLDLFRDYTTPLPPEPLSANEFQRWQNGFSKAWDLLAKYHPQAAEELGTGLSVLVPTTGPDKFSSYSATSTDAFGSIALSLPETPAEFAVTLVHEFAHSKLSSLLDLVSLYEPDPDPRFYAPWRDDPRPLGGLLQGVYSFLSIVMFWRQHRNVVSGMEKRLADFEFAYQREQVTRAVESLRGDEKLTDLGHRFVETMLAEVKSFQTDAVPPDIETLARTACLDHQATWWLCNREPDQDRLKKLVAQPRGVTPVTPEPCRRTALRRLKFQDPDAFERFRPEDLPGTTEADVALIRGDKQRAADLYLADLKSEPDRPGAWIGLALAHESTALLTQPDLVRAAYLQLGDAPHPVELAERV